MECTKCGKNKDADSFYNYIRSKSGKTSACKECMKVPYNPEKSLWSNRKCRYGISKIDFYVMKLNQFGLCSICCEKLPTDNKTHVDHCHKTGAVRGLLCPRCNKVIGYIESKPGVMGNIIDYLE
jgi:hypothetical protein